MRTGTRNVMIPRKRHLGFMEPYAPIEFLPVLLPSNCDIRCQECEAEGKGEDQIDQDEQSAPVLGGQIRKAPEVADADRAARGGHDKTELSGKSVFFMLVRMCCVGFQIQIPAFLLYKCSFFAFCIIHKKRIYCNLSLFGPNCGYFSFFVCKMKKFIYSG